MESPVSRARQFFTIGESKTKVTGKPPFLLDETQYEAGATVDTANPVPVDEVSTLKLPAVTIDQLETQRRLPAVVPLFSSYATFGIDEGLIYDQQTWALPVIPRAGAASNQVPSSTAQTARSESYFALLRSLVKDSGFYAIASLTAPLVTLLLSPFLARTLSHMDYGALAVLNTIVTLVTGVSALGLAPAFMRVYAYDCKTAREQMDTLSTLTLLLLIILLPITATGVIMAPWLSAVLLGSTRYSGAIQVGAVLVLTQNLTIPGLSWLRVERRPALFSTISMMNLLVNAVMTLVLVGALHMGVAGSLVADGLADLIIIACTFPIIFWRAGFSLRLTIATSMLTFGVPHIMNLISGWVLQLSDRYLLGHLVSLSLAAAYSVAYSLGGVTSAAIITPFSLAWWALVYPLAKREDARYVFKLIFRSYSFVLLFATLGLSLFGSSVLNLLFPASYHGQSTIIPIIAVSTMFSGLFNVVSVGVSLQRKTWLISLYFLVSALVNIGLNVVLIPVYGTMGAALATLVAYVALALLAYLCNQWIYPVPFEVGLFLAALGIGIALYLAASSLAHGQRMVITWSLYSATLLLYGLSLLFLGWFLPHTRRTHSQNKSEYDQGRT